MTDAARSRLDGSVEGEIVVGHNGWGGSASAEETQHETGDGRGLTQALSATPRRRHRAATALWLLGLTTFALVLAACSGGSDGADGGNSPMDKLDRISTTDGIKVTVTSCE